MSEQPSTSRTVPNDTATAELPAVIPTMFASIPSIPNSQQLEGVPSGAMTTVWSVPVCSPGIMPGNSYVGTQQIDPFGNQFGQSGPRGVINPLGSEPPRMGGNMLFHYPLREVTHTGAHNHTQVILE